MRNMKIVYPEHCGNAPKKGLLIELYKAITLQDYHYILEHLNDNIIFSIVGDNKVVGKEKVISSIELFIDKGLNEIHIKDVITHGYVAAVYGVFSFEDGMQLEFCDVHVFSGFGKKAKIKEITSYLINPESHKVF